MTGPTGDGDADLARETNDLARKIVDGVLPIRPAVPENPDPAVVDVLELRRRQTPPAAAPEPRDPLHVRAFVTAAAYLANTLHRLRPRRGRYGLLNAVTAVDLAHNALDVAIDLATPHLPIGEDVGPDPAELAVLLGRFERLRLDVELLHFHAGQHLSRMHLAALAHHPDRVIGPPGSDATAEVHAVMLDLLRGERSVTELGAAYRSAIERLRRLRRDPPPT